MAQVVAAVLTMAARVLILLLTAQHQQVVAERFMKVLALLVMVVQVQVLHNQQVEELATRVDILQ